MKTFLEIRKTCKDRKHWSENIGSKGFICDANGLFNPCLKDNCPKAMCRFSIKKHGKRICKQDGEDCIGKNFSCRDW